ncbi:MAG: hypothetical protein JOZ07_14165 [Solirubrobacterales bacterium]|nr:hypothetical protein [Solirubrobacterales bacterium]
MASEPESSGSLRAALSGSALREAMVPRRPVFANPWDKPTDMFACYVAVALVDPFLLWIGGHLMGAIFGFGSHWPLGVFMVAAVVGAGGFMTIVGRERTRLSVDVLAIGIWLVLGLIVAPVIGLALSAIAAIIVFAILLAVLFGYVVSAGRWQRSFLRTLSWPTTWSLLATFFAFAVHQMVLYV